MCYRYADVTNQLFYGLKYTLPGASILPFHHFYMYNVLLTTQIIFIKYNIKHCPFPTKLSCSIHYRIFNRIHVIHLKSIIILIYIFPFIIQTPTNMVTLHKISGLNTNMLDDPFDPFDNRSADWLQVT